MVFIANKGHTHNEGMLRFNPNLWTTLGTSGSNECKRGQLMDGVTKECTTLPTFCCNANKHATYNIWSPFKPNTWRFDACEIMKMDPTSQMPKTCIVLIFKGRYYESIQVLKPKFKEDQKTNLSQLWYPISKSKEVNMSLVTFAWMQDYDLVHPSKFLMESSWAKHHLKCECRLCPTLLDLKVGQLVDWNLETWMIP
jgi:hypothetical protein